MSGSDELGNLTPSSTSQATGQSKSTLIVSCIVISLAVVSVGLRFYTRIFTKTGLKADDWSIFSAVFFALSTAVITLVGTYDHIFVPHGVTKANISKPTALCPTAFGSPRIPTQATSTPTKICSTSVWL
jgi:hypothetical protein